MEERDVREIVFDLAWLTPTVFALAQACYLERGRVCEHCTGPGGENLAYTGKIQGKPCPKCGRLPPPFGNDPPAGDGTLDNDRLKILSDALWSAGCDDEDILQHLREPGPHVRGCWVLDLLLGKT